MNKSLLCVGVAVLEMNAAASAQQQNPLIGAWTVVYANDERAEGPALPQFGTKPVGLLMFDKDGNYSMQICSSGRPKFSAGDRLRGTPEEYRAAASACNTHWGHYHVNEKDGTVVFKIEHALFPNWEGTEQTRPFQLLNGYLRYKVATPSTNAENLVVVWKRMTSRRVTTRIASELVEPAAASAACKRLAIAITKKKPRPKTRL